MVKFYLCRHPGCRQRIPIMGYCIKHQALHQPFAARVVAPTVNWQHLYNSARWRNARKAFLIEHPYCAVCGREATIVHHSIPHRGNEELFWDEVYWEPICKHCHSKETLKEERARRS
ncbi:MAG: HNH endonuclease [Spirochaetae bacterium HGW-Spirochaetae-3]|nr:MAG: HNH endonuclease [Spirochaetae bacterium HGW-Spirochaetae-3]